MSINAQCSCCCLEQVMILGGVRRNKATIKGMQQGVSLTPALVSLCASVFIPTLKTLRVAPYSDALLYNRVSPVWPPMKKKFSNLTM